MSKLQDLRNKNPQLIIHGVEEEAFAPYGRVVPFDARSLIDTCLAELKMPESGSSYVLSDPALMALPAYGAVRCQLRGEMDAQIGICWGYNTRMQAMEYHRSSEHNIAATDMLLLLCDQREMCGNDLEASCVRAFFVPAGTTIEVYATTLHFCPCQVTDDGFVCLVILPQGTNAPLDGAPSGEGESRLLFRRDKWLLCHEENSALIGRGAYPGIHGENYEVRY